MKQLFSLILLVSSLLPFSSVASSGGLGTSYLKLTKNSDPEVVATLSDRDAIPLGFRDERMYCYVADNHKVYQLRGGVTNAHWVELDIASSMKIQGPAGSIPYIDATGLLATDLRYMGKAKYDYSGANTLGSGQYVNVNGINNIVNDRSHNLINAYNSFSDGNYVMMVGERDSALGHHGTILGDDITLNADQQFAAGKGLVGLTSSEVLFGQYNQYSGSANNQWLATDRLLTLGNGTGVNNRSNAMVIYKNGDAIFSGSVAAANLYTKLQIDSMFVVNSTGGGTGVVQSLNLSGTALTITGSNTVNFAGWDINAADDFSGDYNDLSNQPALFSGNYNDLTNKPISFSGDYNDLINLPSFSGWDTDASDDFSGDFADLTNTPNFSSWDQNAADDFSGDYNDLLNLPSLFSGSYNDLTNKPTFAGWDTDASDDFSGNYLDLSNLPNIYLQNQVDSAIAVGLIGAGTQNLNLNGVQLSITSGNSVSFLGWDTDATDDFSGDYIDLANKPKLFSGDYNDLANKPAPFSGSYNDLNNKPSFTGWDQNVSDDFSGDYMDLLNRPSFLGWDTNVMDDFSGDYNDLSNQPVLFSGNYNDLNNTPSFIGWDIDASDDFSGDYNALTNKPALFSGNFVDLINAPNFTGWDIDASDDFNGDYNALTNKPALFSGNYVDLINAPNFTGWDTDASDDFSGDYADLLNKPTVYTKLQVDSMFVVNASGGSGAVQNLNLAGSLLTITGGNSVNFSSWDTDASDDFSGDYNDLSNQPALFNGDYTALSNLPKLFDGDYNKLTNIPSFAGWDTDASDDFSGNFSDLSNVPSDFQDGKISWNEVDSKPQVYTQLQVDSIKQNLLDSLLSYVDSSVISQDHAEVLANRNLSGSDIGKTVYTRANTSVLTIPNGLNLPFNAHIELRDFGSGSLILDASAVTLRDSSGNVIGNSTSSLLIQDAALTALGPNEYKIVGLYQ